MYYAILWDRAGTFEKEQMKLKDELDRSISGQELTQIDEVQRMRAEMGLAPSSPPKPAAETMADRLAIAKKMREEMSLSPKGPPNPA